MVCACLAEGRRTEFAPGGSSNGGHSSQAERRWLRRKGLAEPTWDTFGQGVIRYGIFVPLAK
jgi:hypothetical protein